MEIGYKINDRLSIADIFKIKGIIEKNFNNYVLAENHLNTSLRLNVELENLLNQAETLYEFGLLYKKMKEIKKSRTYFKKSLELFSNLKIINKIKEVKEELNLLQKLTP